MNKERVFALMKDSSLFIDSDISVLKEMVNRYPYSSTMRLLYTQALQANKDIRLDSALKHASIHAPNRKQLYYLIQDDNLTINKEPEVEQASLTDHLETEKALVSEEAPSSEVSDTFEPVKEKVVDEISEKTSETVTSNSQKEDTKETGEKSSVDVLLEKQYITQAVESSISLDIKDSNSLPTRDDLAALIPKKREIIAPPKSLSDFLKGTASNKSAENLPVITPKKKKDFYSPEKMARESLIDREDFMTETLADIYLRQGYYDKAIKAFTYLRLKYPEKSTYFADRIEKIKKAIA